MAARHVSNIEWFKKPYKYGYHISVLGTAKKYGVPWETKKGLVIISYDPQTDAMTAAKAISLKDVVTAWQDQKNNLVIKYSLHACTGMTLGTGFIPWVLSRKPTKALAANLEILREWAMTNHGKKLEHWTTPQEVKAFKPKLPGKEGPPADQYFITPSSSGIDKNRLKSMYARDVGIDHEDAAAKWLKEHGG